MTSKYQRAIPHPSPPKIPKSALPQMKEAWMTYIAAQQAWMAALALACSFLDLDRSTVQSVNTDTGEITFVSKPTLVKDEAVASAS